jgi:hypothetical protein
MPRAAATCLHLDAPDAIGDEVVAPLAARSQVAVEMAAHEAFSVVAELRPSHVKDIGRARRGLSP